MRKWAVSLLVSTILVSKFDRFGSFGAGIGGVYTISEACAYEYSKVDVATNEQCSY